MIRRPPKSTLVPYTTLSRSGPDRRRRTPGGVDHSAARRPCSDRSAPTSASISSAETGGRRAAAARRRDADRKSTRLNSSHANISYAVFCLKKKIQEVINIHLAHKLTTGILFFNDTATTEIYARSLHDALPIWPGPPAANARGRRSFRRPPTMLGPFRADLGVDLLGRNGGAPCGGRAQA